LFFLKRSRKPDSEQRSGDGREAIMTEMLSFQGRKPIDPSAADRTDLDTDSFDLDFLDSGVVPPSAPRWRITDLQKWIDLCA
jgi:hypothetical protein